MGNFIDLTGLKINYLIVLRRSEEVNKQKNKSVMWVCLCTACNKEYHTTSGRLTHKQKIPISCGCLSSNGTQKTQGFEEISGNWWNRRVLRNLKNRGDKRKLLGVTITIAEAWNIFKKQDRKCALSGVPLVISDDHKINTASIDRIDSNVGYHRENIQWVHKNVNRMKNIFDEKYFVEFCKKIAEHDNNK